MTSFSILPAIVTFAVLAAVFSYLYRVFRHDHFLLWAAGWLLLLAGLAVPGGPAGPAGGWSWLEAGTVLAAAAALVAGATAFAGRGRLGVGGGLALGGAVAVLTTLIFLAVHTLHPAPAGSWIAAVSFLAAGGLGAGWLIERHGRRVAPLGSRLGGLALAAWGAFRPVGEVLAARGMGEAWLAPLDAGLGAALAIGMVILGVEEASARTTAGQGARQALLADDPNMILVLQGDLCVFANQEFERRMGLKVHDIEVPAVLERVAPEHRDQGLRNLAERRAGRPVPDYEIELLDGQGARVPVIVHAAVIQWKGEPALKYEFTDISFRKQVEEEVRAVNVELQRINAELERSNRLKSEFLSNTSHELKTPLTSIIANTEILEYEMCGPVNPEQKQILESIGRNSQHLLEMISRLLDFARYEEGGDVLRYERVDPRMLIDGVVRTVSPLIENRPLQLDVEVEKGFAPCWLDGEKVYRIYLNLVENAIKFSDSGTIRIGARWVDGEMEGSVSDEGIGIPPHQREEIFDAFRQVDASVTRAYQGVGLGLAICKQLVELHHGRIWVEPGPERGSVFRFRVPAPAERP